MGQDIECIPVVNLNAIAKDADAKDLLRLCQLVVALAVQSENNNMYIEMIQSLTQKSQHALMVSIEEVCLMSIRFNWAFANRLLLDYESD
jgi:methylglyoxal synthase